MEGIGQWDRKSAPELLALERLDRDLFRNRLNQANANDALFGGQVLAQALTAACHTLDGRPVHSLHGYFLRAGRAHTHVIYQVDRTRDGGRFSTRRVIAIQEGEPIFHMECGFHAEEEGFVHQTPAPPDIPAPDSLLDLKGLATAWADRLPEWMAERWRRNDSPIEIRLVNPENLIGESAEKTPTRRLWMRLPSGAHADPVAQYCLLAYMSDYWLGGTAAIPHTVALPSPSLFLVSLDHAMWFHRPVRTDEWLFFDCDSPSAQAGRGLSRGLIFDQAGALVASVAQEALMRARR